MHRLLVKDGAVSTWVNGTEQMPLEGGVHPAGMGIAFPSLSTLKVLKAVIFPRLFNGFGVSRDRGRGLQR